MGKVCYVLAVFLGTLTYTAVEANTLGERNSNGERKFWQLEKIRGTVLSASPDGYISLHVQSRGRYANQNINLKQVRVLGFDKGITQQIQGEELRCLIILEYEGIPIVDCLVVIERLPRFSTVKLNRIQEESNPNFKGCTKFENDAFRNTVHQLCPPRTKNDDSKQD